jgi:hypothetical protein
MGKWLLVNRRIFIKYFFISRRPDCRQASFTQKKTQIFADFEIDLTWIMH